MTGPGFAEAPRMVLGSLVGALVLTLGGCGDESGGTESSAGGGLTLDDVWARPTPPDSDRTAIYAIIDNQGDEADRLTSVSSDRCTVAELHATVVDDTGVARMRPAEDSALTVEPDRRLQLEPGGLHVMCMGVAEPLAEGDTFAATFTFESGSTVEATATTEQR